MIDRGEELCPNEVKAGKTINSRFFNHLNDWRKLEKNTQTEGCLIYGGWLSK